MAINPTERQTLGARSLAVDESIDGDQQTANIEQNGFMDDEDAPDFLNLDADTDKNAPEQDGKNLVANDPYANRTDDGFDSDTVFDNDFLDMFQGIERTWFERVFLDNTQNMVLVIGYISLFLFASGFFAFMFFAAPPSLDDIIQGRPTVFIDPLTVEVVRTKKKAIPQVTQEQKQEDSSPLSEDEQIEEEGEPTSKDALESQKAEALAEQKIPKNSRQANLHNVLAKYGETAETALITDDIQDAYSNRLAKAPIAGLYEEGPTGILPKIGRNGTTVFEAYARPSTIPDNHIPIAVVMYGLGQNDKLMGLALKLPGDVTLSLVPYGKNLIRWAEQIRKNGHEMAITLPIQPINFPEADAGPNGLMRGVEVGENLSRFFWAISQFQGYSSIMIEGGGIFMNDPSQFTPIFQEIKGRGLAIVNMSNAPSLFKESAQGQNIMHAQFDLIIEDAFSRTSFLQKLLEAEIEAQTKGNLIIGIAPYPNNVQRLRDWSKDLSNRNITLVPLSKLIQLRQK